MSLSRTLLAATAAISLAMPALAGSEITIEDAYARASGPTAMAGAAFLVIHNTGDADDRLIAVELHPEDFGLPVHPFEDIVGGTPEHNARAFRALLDGEASAYRDAVLLNAAAALTVAGKAGDLREGVAMARESIDAGVAREKVACLARATQAA